VKKIVRLFSFFSLCFIIILLLASAINFFQAGATNSALVTLPGSFLWKFIASARGMLPVTLYITVLLSLSYTARREIGIRISIIGVFVLALGWTALSSFAIVKTDVPPLPIGVDKTVVLGNPGVILAAKEGIAVLANGPHSPAMRVVAKPGQTLDYLNDAALQISSLTMPLPFRNDPMLFADNLAADFFKAASHLESLLNDGFLDFFIYAAALIFLLVSMRFIMGLSSWPFANLFLGAVVFWGLLELELFVDSVYVQKQLASIIRIIPDTFLGPCVFCVLGLVVMGLTGLVYLVSRGKSKSKSRLNSKEGNVRHG
jgi:hypothetical protein